MSSSNQDERLASLKVAIRSCKNILFPVFAGLVAPGRKDLANGEI